MTYIPGGTSGGVGNIATSGDVALNNPANGQVLTYDKTIGKWKNAPVSVSDGGNPALKAAELHRSSPTEPWRDNNGTIYDSIARAALRPQKIRWNCLSGAEPIWSSNDGDANVRWHDEIVYFQASGSDPQEDVVPPAAPTALTLVSVADSSALISFTESTDNIAVVNYLVYANGILRGQAVSSPCNIAGLTPATTYSVTAKAVDAAGNQSAGSTAITVATTGTSLPAPVLNIGAIGQSTVAITWAPPSSGPAPTGLRYGWHSYSGLPVPDWSTTTSPSNGGVTLTNLVADSDYDIWVERIDGTETGARTTILVRTAAATTSPPPGGELNGNLPTKIVGVWMSIWGGPTASQINALSANRRPNLVSVAVAQSGGSGTGRLTFSPSGSQISATDVSYGNSLGINYILLIGGSGDGGIRLTNSTQRDEMIASIKSIVDTYGFNGIDWDIESETSWSPSIAVEVTQALKNHYGSGFIVSYAPRPYEIRSTSGKGYDFIVRLGSLLDVFFAQFYDANEWKDDTFLLNNTKNDFKALLNAGIPASKMGIGCITDSTYSLGWNDAATYLQAFDEIEAVQPSLRGTQMWWAPHATRDDWLYTRTMNAGIRNIT